MARRGSNLGVKATGEPYQVFFEVCGTGQTFEQTKKKVRWVLGFTDIDNEIEVVLKHSLLSGKKTIIENGQEIVSATNMLATDFSHGWTSPSCGHFFRIEATVSLSQDTYVLSVDGVRFELLQRKPMGGAKKTDASAGGRYANESTTDSAQRRQSATAVNRNSNSHLQQQPPQHQQPAHSSGLGSQSADRNSLRQKKVSSNDVTESFDPFASKSNPVDPFATPSAVAQRVTPARPPAATVDLLGDAFDGPSPASGSALPPADPFFAPSTAASASVAFDPFASPAPAAQPTKTAVVPHDPFALPPTPPQFSAHSSSTKQQDFLGFDNTPQKQPVRRSSAIEIAQDFADMTFTAAPAQQQQPMRASVAAAPSVPIELVEPVQAPKPPSAAPADLWQSDLVNLNLSNDVQNGRRQSANIATGPSLDSLMQNGAPAQRRSSMMAGSAAPAMGYSSQPMMMNSGPVIQQAPQQRGSISMSSPPMGMQPAAYSINSGYSMQPPSQPMANANKNLTASGSTKSSLDSLDWKSFQ